MKTSPPRTAASIADLIADLAARGTDVDRALQDLSAEQIATAAGTVTDTGRATLGDRQGRAGEPGE